MARRDYKSDALASVHESAVALFKVGAIDKTTMREFDRMALVPVRTLTPSRIKAVREANNVSQSVFAKVLNTSVSTVQKWETGAKAPSGMALTLLHVVERKGLSVLTD
jgi:putative transcriptional regulator